MISREFGTVSFVGSLEENGLGDRVLKPCNVDMFDVREIVVYETGIVLFISSYHDVRPDSQISAIVRFLPCINIFGKFYFCNDLLLGIFQIKGLLP